jgi:hypothetical protein
VIAKGVVAASDSWSAKRWTAVSISVGFFIKRPHLPWVVRLGNKLCELLLPPEELNVKHFLDVTRAFMAADPHGPTEIFGPIFFIIQDGFVRYGHT